MGELGFRDPGERAAGLVRRGAEDPGRSPPLLAPGEVADEYTRQLMVLEEEERAIKYGLPHLHAFKWYPWALTYFESRNKMNFLCAANQISKSSTQIRKAIHWATSPELWAELWPATHAVGINPNLFWYFYPTNPVATTEFRTKWLQFLPRGRFKDHPVYGWKEFFKNKNSEIDRIEFNSGVTIMFKGYSQKVNTLQTATVFAVFCDEELPEAYYDELKQRLSGTDGYFHMCFTATLGQEIWRLTIEPEESEKGIERFPDALKIQVTMYDCLEYTDGSKSPWTIERIQRIIDECSDENEVQRRVFGRFILSQSRLIPSFQIKRHMKPMHPIPSSWLVYSGSDIGGGGPDAHKSAIAFVAVSPDFRQGRVFMGWRGDDDLTTASDVVLKHESMRGKRPMTETRYDYGCKDFKTISDRLSMTFLPANKDRLVGEKIVDDLFKNDMLFIYRDPELQKLASELVSLRKTGGAKRNLKDDFYDALRYCVATIPWDWAYLVDKKLAVEEDEGKGELLEEQDPDIRARRERFIPREDSNHLQSFEEEFAEANEAYGE